MKKQWGATVKKLDSGRCGMEGTMEAVVSWVEEKPYWVKAAVWAMLTFSFALAIFILFASAITSPYGDPPVRVSKLVVNTGLFLTWAVVIAWGAVLLYGADTGKMRWVEWMFDRLARNMSWSKVFTTLVLVMVYCIVSQLHTPWEWSWLYVALHSLAFATLALAYAVAAKVACMDDMEPYHGGVMLGIVMVCMLAPLLGILHMILPLFAL